MKYEIGDIVKHYKDFKNNYIILATKEQSLNNELLLSKEMKYNIKDIDKMAMINLSVEIGFHYKIGKIVTYTNEVLEISKFINAFENDLES